MQHIKDLLERYISDGLSAEEKSYVDKWLEENENPAAEWLGLDDVQKQEFVTNLHSCILQKIDGKSARIVTMKNRFKWASIAAAAIVLLGVLSWFIWQSGKNNHNKQNSFAVTHSRQGQKDQVKLPDGSIVWLNESATLRYPESFNDSSREVWLDGEAYFDIFHDPSKRFVVHSGGVETTVLGTAFNIKNDKEKGFAIAVLRGKVRVTTDAGKVLGDLVKNEALSLDKSGQINKTLNNAEGNIAWLPTDLKFDDLTLDEVVKLLEQQYSKKIKLKNPTLANCRFSGSAPITGSLDDVLKAVCAFNNATYKYAGENDIIIDGQGCK